MGHPCSGCESRCVGCRVSCVDLLAHNIFDRKTYKPNPKGTLNIAQYSAEGERHRSASKRKATTKEWLTDQNISYSEYMRSDVVVNCL